MKRRRVEAGLCLLVLMAACSGQSSVETTDAWLGQWNGPEGTLLLITGGAGTYELTVRNLDGPQVFDGRSVDGGIEFERAGEVAHIRATDGPGTGMKWLADKQDCLVIRPGEGFCRDAME